MARIAHAEGSHGDFSFDIDTGEVVKRTTTEKKKGDYPWITRIAIPETIQLQAAAGDMDGIVEDETYGAINVCYYDKKGKLEEGAVWLDGENVWKNRFGVVTG